MKVTRWFYAFLLFLLAGFAKAADVVGYNTANGTLNLGPDIQYTNSTYQSASYRFIVYKGTVNINSGANIKTGGNSSSVCNYIGVDQPSPAVVNINGGMLWCTTEGGGAGCLGIGINNNNTLSTLNLNAGTLRVDNQVRSGVAWNSMNGRSNSGTVTVGGGEALVNQFVIGANSESTGASTLNLNGGRLTVNELNFQSYNGQTFNWGNGTLIAGRANIFVVAEYRGTNKTRSMTITGGPSIFDTAGFDQIIPPFTGTGKLRLTGGGIVTFEESTLTYGLVLDGISLNLGALEADVAPLTIPNLELLGPATLYVTPPASPSGRYPLIACTSWLVGFPYQITTSGGAGKVVRDGNTLYLSFEEDNDSLVYSAAAGGTDTPESANYSRLLFTDAAGAFTVAGDGLSFAQSVVDMGAAKQTITAPVTFSAANTPIYVADNGCLELAGGLTATTPVKDGPGTLVLGNDTLPESISLKEGVVDFAGQIYTGALPLYSATLRRGFGREITYTNGVWRYNGLVNFEYQDNILRFADGFTLDATVDSNSRFAIGYTGTDWGDVSNCTKVVVDGGTVNVRGNSSNTCNFIGVDRSGTGILEIIRGTFHTDGYMRIAAGGNQKTVGIVRVEGGELQIANDLWMGTVYNGANAGQGTATFEMTGGQTTLRNFFAGATSSSIASSTVNLLGGVFEVAMFKCQACCRQAVTADDVIFRARQNDSGGDRFMSAVESADSYEKTFTVGANGLTIDTAGYDVRCDIPWAGEGGLAVTGGGSFKLDSAVELSGNVTVADGTMFGTSVSQVFPGTLTLGAGTKILFDVSALGNDRMSLATGGFVLPDGVDDVLELVELTDTVNYIAKTIDGGNTIEISSSADVPVTANWTGAAGTNDISDPANWVCKNAAGAVVADALPGPTTTVYVDGVTSFTLPADAELNWVGITVGANGGMTALSADCDWSVFGDVVLADNAVIDLRGHNLKVTRLLSMENGTAVVTNSVAGVRPDLWRVNAASESDFIATPSVTVCTDVVRVKIINEGAFSAPSGTRIGTAMDADFVQTSGTIESGANRNVEMALGASGYTGTYSITGDGYAHLGHIHIGAANASTGLVYVAESAKIDLVGWITVGYAAGAYGEMVQDGGEVKMSDDLNIGLNNVGVGTYQMNGGTLTVSGSLVPGRSYGIGTFMQSAGVVNANSYLTIGYAGGKGTYTMTGGELKVANRELIISQSANSLGVLDVAGGVATASNKIIVGHSSTGTLRVRDGGRLEATTILSGSGAATIEFDGGTLAALADNEAFISGVTNVVFGTRGVTLDNGGYDIGLSECTLMVNPAVPAITMTGTGTLDLSGCTLELTDDAEFSFTLATADGGTFTGVPVFDRKGWQVKVSNNGKSIRVIRPGLMILFN